MQEVDIQLRFTTACIGSVRRSVSSGQGVIYRMIRDGSNNVVFLPSWWQSAARYAVKVLNRYDKLVNQITWGRNVYGELADWRRNVGYRKRKLRYALHEAYRPGTFVTLTAVLPQGMTPEAMFEILDVIGRYKGVSPFQRTDQRYGLFETISVSPACKAESV